MALQTNITTEQGIPCSQAYSKIEDVRLTKTEARVMVNTYYNAQAREDGKPPLTVKMYEMSITDGSVSWSSIYTHLKTLPEFSGANDC